MAITVTESAANQISKQLAKRDQTIGLKIGVRKSGCSGYAYTLDYAERLNDDDQIYETHGVKVIVNNADLEYLNGIELDFRREGLNEAFKFNNPNVVATCGCGESFAVSKT